MKTLLATLGMAALLAGTARAQDKKDAPPVGPYSLPLLATVKEKCKTNDAQNGKLDVIYKDAAAKEEETKKTGRDNQTDRKDLEKFLLMGKNDTINKVRDVLDPDQQKTFTALVAASDPKKKK